MLEPALGPPGWARKVANVCQTQHRSQGTTGTPHRSGLGQVRAQDNGCRELSVSLSQFLAPHCSSPAVCQQLGGTGDTAVKTPRHSPCSWSGEGRADQEAAGLGKGHIGRRTAESGKASRRELRECRGVHPAKGRRSVPGKGTA